MTKSDIKKIFVKNLNRLLAAQGKNQNDIVQKVNVSSATVSDWCNGKKFPRMNKVEELADLFGVTVSDLLTEPESELEKEEYYWNKETRKIAKRAYEDARLRLLFDAYENATPEGLEAIIAMAKMMKAQEKNEEP